MPRPWVWPKALQRHLPEDVRMLIEGIYINRLLDRLDDSGK